MVDDPLSGIITDRVPQLSECGRQTKHTHTHAHTQSKPHLEIFAVSSSDHGFLVLVCCAFVDAVFSISMRVGVFMTWACLAGT